MMNANIVKKGTPISKMIVLLPVERRNLQKKITGHGKLKEAVSTCGLDQNTLKRAIAGFKVLPETADKIRSLIKDQGNACGI